MCRDVLHGSEDDRLTKNRRWFSVLWRCKGPNQEAIMTHDDDDQSSWMWRQGYSVREQICRVEFATLYKLV